MDTGATENHDAHSRPWRFSQCDRCRRDRFVWVIRDPSYVLHDADCLTLLAHDCAVYAHDYFTHGQVGASVALALLAYGMRLYARELAREVKPPPPPPMPAEGEGDA